MSGGRGALDLHGAKHSPWFFDFHILMGRAIMAWTSFVIIFFHMTFKLDTYLKHASALASYYRKCSFRN